MPHSSWARASVHFACCGGSMMRTNDLLRIARLDEVDACAGLACAQTWFQHLLTVIMSAILGAVRDRPVAEESRDTAPIGLGDGGPFDFGQPVALIDGEGRQHLDARVEQHAVLDRPQQVVEPPIHAALAIMRRASTDRDG